MPQIDTTVSLGNVISIAGTLLSALGMASAMFVWGGKLSERSTSFERELLQMQSSAAIRESRLRSIEQNSARQDERLILILDSLRKIENRLERRDTSPAE